MRTCLLSFLLVFGWHLAQAQATDSVVVVYKDARIDALNKRQKAVNKTVATIAYTVNGQMKGWRIQVLNTNNRELANKTKADLLMRFPMHKSYLMYQTPFFKVRIGNFKDRGSAEDLKKQLRAMFPTGVYIIPDIIEYKITKEDLEDAEKENK
jgi:hypothetical protein